MTGSANASENAHPSLLWDADRLRVQWANAAGIAQFGAETLFDLIDRPFDISEPGVARIRQLKQSLEPGESRREMLEFPSLEENANLQARVSLKLLPDGRQGVLLEILPQEAAQILDPVFEALPQPVLVLDRAGTVMRANQAANSLGPISTLADLIGTKAADMINRLAQAGTLSGFARRVTELGEREFRYTLRRLPDGSGANLALLEDVTERRQLERSLSQSPLIQTQFVEIPQVEVPHAEVPEIEAATTAKASEEPSPKAAAERPIEANAASSIPRGKLSQDDHRAFAEIARQLQPIVPPKPALSAQENHVPQVVRNLFDSTAEPVMILRQGKILFANSRAQKDFGGASGSVLGREDLAAALSLLPLGESAWQFSSHAYRVKAADIAWYGGPARQIVIKAQANEAKNQAPDESPEPEETEAEAIRPEPAVNKEIAEEEIAAPEVAVEVAEAVAVEETEAQELPAPNVTAQEAAAPESPSQDSLPQIADSELSAILDTASDGIITIDDKARIGKFSAGAEALFGVKREDVRGEEFTSLFASQSRKIVRDYISALSDQGLASVFNDGREVTALCKPDGQLSAFLTLSRLGDGYCAVVRDITQWKQTEAELRFAKEEAEKASSQKSEFLARISHELRTPLNAILGFSDVMRDERFGPIGNARYRTYAEDIHASGKHLLSLINDLLDLSKIEAGKLELDFTKVSLNKAAQEAMHLMTEEARNRRVILRDALPNDLPQVVADQRSMRQILLNLLSNAVKFTATGGQIIIAARLEDNGELTLKVSDSGPGMSAAEIETALEPFRSQSRDRAAEGTGLGLPLTKALAEANRARFAILSEPGRGTSIEITFPVTRVLAE